jgi:hypothetical protein
MTQISNEDYTDFGDFARNLRKGVKKNEVDE